MRCSWACEISTALLFFLEAACAALCAFCLGAMPAGCKQGGARPRGVQAGGGGGGGGTAPSCMQGPAKGVNCTFKSPCFSDLFRQREVS